MQQNDDDLVYDQADDDLKHQSSKPPSVLGEEDVSGDAPAEVMDIDEALASVGLRGDKYDKAGSEESPEALNVDDEIK